MKKIKQLAVAIAVIASLSSCTKESSTVITNEIPEPNPQPEMVELLPSATWNGTQLNVERDSLDASFLTIGLGQGYGSYFLNVFADSTQMDTLRSVNVYENFSSLRKNVTVKFPIQDLQKSKTYYWNIVYKQMLVKSQLRNFRTN